MRWLAKKCEVLFVVIGAHGYAFNVPLHSLRLFDRGRYTFRRMTDDEVKTQKINIDGLEA